MVVPQGCSSGQARVLGWETVVVTDVTNELMFELLKKMQSDMSAVRFDLQEIKRRITATEEAMAGVNRRLDRQDERLDRIERRLELRELAEPQHPFEH